MLFLWGSRGKLNGNLQFKQTSWMVWGVAGRGSVKANIWQALKTTYSCQMTMPHACPNLERRG